MRWGVAGQGAQPMPEGVRRGRVATSEPGVELAYLDWGGDGELIVLHHAVGFSAACYAPIAHRLRDRYRLIAGAAGSI